jgi:hypothetical protein
VVSGFSETFEHVPVRPGERLVYLIAKAQPTGNDARGTVTLERPGAPPVVLADDLPPSPRFGALDWRLRSVPIPVTAPAEVRLRFAASSPSGVDIGDWVAFAAPVIVR